MGECIGELEIREDVEWLSLPINGVSGVTGMQTMVFPEEVECVGAPMLMTKLAELQRERVFRWRDSLGFD